MALYATKDEVITCTNQHPIARFSDNVNYGQIDTKVIDFCFGTNKPTNGTELLDCVCNKCGEPYVTPPGMIFHFKEGWRP